MFSMTSGIHYMTNRLQTYDMRSYSVVHKHTNLSMWGIDGIDIVLMLLHPCCPKQDRLFQVNDN